ncbi:putative glycoside hydrolase family 16 protein [Zalerion maritima]|uniref:endo-1,3(4)-beta-glucanase n=1 Tax=Zalerion maritima TaxID=339359 RepID=A0AAD5RPI9_9PEZI|nr:putative glycoside hydrolase family 16 protein [Zalerion maritima]
MPRPVTLVLGAAAFTGIANAQQYKLVDNFTEENFFDNFDFINQTDPTHGLVNYVAAQTANNQRLAGYYSGGVYLGADHTNQVSSDGRPSVRVESKKTYNHGLFIGDFAHMPEGCGTWPAFWTYGINPTWPDGGEIDIIEGVNAQETNAMTLHTGAGCSVTMGDVHSGTNLTTDNCNDNEGKNGCGEHSTDTTGYGSGFNAKSGGVYAMEWTSESITVWYFPRDSIPDGVLDTDTPDTSNFGTPAAQFIGGDGCIIDDHFMNHVIVINLTLCGDWAGKVWDEDSTCTAKASTCNEYVENNPDAFTDAYWLVNSVRTFEQTSSSKRDIPKPFTA